MALGVMAIFFAVIVAIAIASILLLLLVSSPKASGVVVCVTAIVALVITYFNASALPSNYVVRTIISYAFGILPLVALVLQLGLKSHQTLAKILVGISIVAGILLLIF